MESSRIHYADRSNSTNYTYTDLVDAAKQHVPLSQQLKYKYSFSTDGYSVSARLAKVLATGQVRQRG